MHYLDKQDTSPEELQTDSINTNTNMLICWLLAVSVYK